jgi:outer membrane protein
MLASHPRRPRLALTALASLILAAMPGLAGAQSLLELYDAARAYDASYLAARALADSAEFKAAQAEALGRPSLNATAAGATTQYDYPRAGSQNVESLQGSFNGRFPLFNRANAATIEQARKSLEIAKADVDTAEQDLIVRVAQAYFDVLGAQDTLAATRANKAATVEQLASAKRNFEVGTATITDQRESQAKFDLSVAQEIAADNDLLTKRIALDQLVGRTGVVPKPLIVPVVLPPVAAISAEEWVTLADQQHPSVRRARVGYEVAQLETTKARAGELPTFDAVASLGSSYSKGPAIAVPGTTNSASLGVQMNWPLYTGSAVQNRIKETLSLEEKARNDLQAARRGVAQSTRQAYFGVQSGVAQVTALVAAEESVKLALDAIQLGYKVGVRVNLDVLNTQTTLYNTQRDLAKSRYEVLVGALRLRQASGQLKPSDIDIVNSLLAK